MKNDRHEDERFIRALRAGPPRASSTSTGFARRVENAWRTSAAGEAGSRGTRSVSLWHFLAPALALAMLAGMVFWMVDGSGQSPLRPGAGPASLARESHHPQVPPPMAVRRKMPSDPLARVSFVSVDETLQQPYLNESRLLADDAVRTVRLVAQNFFPEKVINRAERVFD